MIVQRPHGIRSALALAVLLAGCATYRPEPLSDNPALLSPPVLAAVARDAAAIERPFLRPAAIDAEPLDPNAVATLTVLLNPDLRALRERAGVADAQAFAAGLLPDPSFSLGADQVLSGPDTLLGLAASLGLNLAALRTRGVAREQADAEARRVRLDLAWAEWQTSGQARHPGGADRRARARRRRSARASRDDAQSILDRMLRAAGRGDILPDQVQAARDRRLRCRGPAAHARSGTLPRRSRSFGASSASRPDSRSGSHR